MESIACYKSPVGILEIKAGTEGITSISFRESEADCRPGTPAKQLDECLQQLDEYFKGTLTEFRLPLAPEGTDFHKKVWAELARIEYGKTISYQALSHRLKNPKAIRAVGTANGKNPLAIVVPCHRVIGSGGNLTGYAGGLWRKKWLLEHEKKVKFGANDLFDGEADK